MSFNSLSEYSQDNFEYINAIENRNEIGFVSIKTSFKLLCDLISIKFRIIRIIWANNDIVYIISENSGNYKVINIFTEYDSDQRNVYKITFYTRFKYL